MIQLKNIDIGYHSALLSIENLVLETGKFYAIIGKNGIGKTTFIHTILGLIPTIKGEIEINSQNIHRISANQRAKLVAHVPSKFEGVQHLSTRDFIAMGRAPYTNFLGKLAEEDWKLVDEISAELGIESFLRKDTSELSDGERQIASIAKALVQKTPVIVLDEPTAFLDYANRMSVQKLLQKVAKNANVCIIQSSHDLELCLEFADEMLIVEPNKKTIIPINRANCSKEKVIEIAF
jgi:iron complex transport system ATP-binding protein